MNLTSSNAHGAVIVAVNGRVDQTTSEAFAAALKPFLDQCAKDKPPVVLDFTSLEYISSVGLRALMMAARQSKAQQGKLAVACLNPVVQEVFTITRFNLVLPCHATVEAAAKALAS